MDARTVADRWLKLLRPRIRRALDARRGRRKMWTIFELEQDLYDNPFPLDQLRAAFADVPMLAPVESRVIVAIIGVPPTQS